MKILFARPPRYMWTFHSKHSSFWQPLGFASMAAVLRENTGDIEIKIIDCPALNIGWKSAKQIILREKPDILCVGEETVSVNEAFKLVCFTKSVFPETIIIAGGHYFTYMVHGSLNNHPIDFIVRFEGEITLLELIRELKKPKNLQDFKKIKGIAYKENNRIIETPLRGLLDMENLPMPAYDLLQMNFYGKRSANHRDFVAVEHGRGCICACNFCTLWKQMGKIDLKKGIIRPFYRTKSVKKTVDEIVYLHEKYKRKTFCWVDPTWNIEAKWNYEFSKEMIKSGIDIDHSVWMRADFIARDEMKGIFKHQVRAGIKQVMVGVERTDDDDLAYFEKHNYSFETSKKAFEIIRKYPQVLSIATYIYGLPNETKESLKRFYEKLAEIPFDIGVPIPLTPNPGTRFFEELENKNLLEIKNFNYYNFMNPVARSKYLSRNNLLFYMLMNEIRTIRAKEFFRRFTLKSERRKNAVNHLARDKAIVTLRYIRGMLQELVFNKVYNYNIKPKWYNS